MGGPTRYTDPDGLDWIYSKDNQAINVRSVEKGQQRIREDLQFEVKEDEGNFKSGDQLQYLSGGRVLIKVAGPDQKLPAGTIITYDFNQQPISTQLPVDAPPPLDSQLASSHGNADPFTAREPNDAPTLGNPEMVLSETQASCINDGYVNVPIRIPASYEFSESSDVPAEMSEWEISAAPPNRYDEGFFEYQRDLFLARTGSEDGTVDNPAHYVVRPGGPISRIPLTSILPGPLVEELYGPARVPYEEVGPETFEAMFEKEWDGVYAGVRGRGFIPPAGTRVAPGGIPKTWRVRPSKGAGGTWYFDPRNKGNAVRVMPGDPLSPFPNSRAPYVRWQRNGQPLDVNGKVLPTDRSPDAHIPLPMFKFIKELFE